MPDPGAVLLLLVAASLVAWMLLSSCACVEEGMVPRRDTAKALALTCASTAEGSRECGWLWDACVHGDDAAACEGLGDARRMAMARHGPVHPLVRHLT